MMRLVAFLIFLVAASGAHAQCYKDVGQKKARSFGSGQQLLALKAQIKKKNCKIYGLRWSVASGGDKVEKSLLIFNTQTGELIKARSIPKGDKRRLEAESWTRVTKTSLANDQPGDGFSQRHHMKLEKGASIVPSGTTTQFMKQRQLAGFLNGGYLTAGISSDPDVEVEVVEPETSGTVAALAPVDSTATPAPDSAAGVAPQAAAAAAAELKACLKNITDRGEKPSAEAKASSASCDEELQIIEGRQALLNAKQARFNDLVDAHVTGKLSDCLAKLERIGGKVTDKLKESGEACEKALKSQMAKASDKQIHAMLEAERFHDRRMELIWLIEKKSARDEQLQREERRHQRDVAYLENCVKEIIDLGGKPSDKAIVDWNICQREKYEARAQARIRTNELEQQIVKTRDINAKRQLAQQIPLPDMKKYWLSEIERQQRQASTQK